MKRLHFSLLGSPCFYKARLDHTHIASTDDALVSTDHPNLVSDRELDFLVESGHYGSE